MDYKAKRGYRDQSRVDRYVETRFSGLLGKYRYLHEQRAVKKLISYIEPGSKIADIPCGIGRWWPALQDKASEIAAFDLSPVMVEKARERSTLTNQSITVNEGDAENIDLGDSSVDYVFSFALFKHLPIPVQYKVLLEFSRVCRKGVIVSYGQFGCHTYPLYRVRNSRQKSCSMLLPAHVEHMSYQAGLRLIKSRTSSHPMGTERVAFLAKTFMPSK